MIDYEELYTLAIDKLNTVNFSTGQFAKLKLACHKTVLENPAVDIDECLVAVKIYYQYIVDFPEVEL
jgi:hypothetical protein